jgi:transcriptional regulator of acetoin/glycerol metabolism
LLLDEIGEMPLATQAKLLRVLEDSKVRRLGSRSEISVDVRVLAATNKVPEEAVAQGQLRSDLYFPPQCCARRHAPACATIWTTFRIWRRRSSTT